jgi:hypothetical protein
MKEWEEIQLHTLIPAHELEVFFWRPICQYKVN